MLFNLLQIYTIMRLKVTINVQIRNLTTQNKREREIIVVNGHLKYMLVSTQNILYIDG